jgi:DNA (cytosine-5)-methyltransferase 1
MPSQAAVELCSGMGGIGIGISELGFAVERAYDSWSDAVDVYNHNHANGKSLAVRCDLLSSRGLRAATTDKKRIGQVELVVAGPPCKGFSQLKNGHHDGRKAHNRANNRVLQSLPQYIGLFRPRLVLIENVPALAIHRSGATLKDFLRALSKPARLLSYRVDYRVYDAAQFGTPQSRSRLIIFGVRIDADRGETLPVPGPDLRSLYTAVRHGKPVPERFKSHYAQLMDREAFGLVTASQALSDLPALGAGEAECPRPYASLPQSAFQQWARARSAVQVTGTQTPEVKKSTTDRLRHIPPGGSIRDIPPKHVNGLSRRFGSAYRRLHPDAPSTALSTKYDCVYHYAHGRSLSLREYSRLQGIPDRITFPSNIVSRRHAYEMIGNSVPPLLIERVLSGILGGAEV